MKKMVLLLLLFIIGVFVYARYYNNYNISVKEYTITEETLPIGFDDLKIIHFSDLLYEKEKDLDLLKNAVAKINELNGDIIIFTGDLTKKDVSEEEKQLIINELKKIECSLYKYGISGDNDIDDIASIYEKSDFIYLNNKSEYLFNKDTTPILIVGGNNITEETFLKDESINYAFKIALIHKPDDVTTINSLDFNLIFAGHSLGGQIRLPFWGALIKKDGANTYTNDYYKENNAKMYVSYGLGNEKFPFRIFNEPSINVYRLYTK